MTPANLLEFSTENWDAAVLGSASPVLVDFWAPWCAPCKALTPTLDKLAGEFAGRITLGKLDIQAHPAVAGRLGIRSIPTLLLFRGGKVVDSLVGVVSEDTLRDRLQAAAGA